MAVWRYGIIISCRNNYIKGSAGTQEDSRASGIWNVAGALKGPRATVLEARVIWYVL